MKAPHIWNPWLKRMITHNPVDCMIGTLFGLEKIQTTLVDLSGFILVGGVPGRYASLLHTSMAPRTTVLRCSTNSVSVSNMRVSGF